MTPQHLYSDIHYKRSPGIAIIAQRLPEHHLSINTIRFFPHLGILEDFVHAEIDLDRVQDQFVSRSRGLIGNVVEFLDQIPTTLPGPDGDRVLSHGGESD